MHDEADDVWKTIGRKIFPPLAVVHKRMSVSSTDLQKISKINSYLQNAGFLFDAVFQLFLIFQAPYNHLKGDYRKNERR